MKSKYFGEIKFDNHFNALVCDDKKIQINNKEIDISLWFDEDDNITVKKIQKADDFLDNINSVLKGIEIEMKNNLESKESVYEYIKHHIEELDIKKLVDLGINDKSNKIEQISNLFQKIELKKIGVYPTKSISEEFAVFDFSIGYDYIQYVIAVNVKRKGKIVYIAMES